MKKSVNSASPSPWFEEPGYLRRISTLEPAFLARVGNPNARWFGGRRLRKTAVLPGKRWIGFLGHGSAILRNLMDTVLRAATVSGARLSKRIRFWHQQRATLRALMALDDYLLKDIGLSRGWIPAAAKGDWIPGANSREVKIRHLSTPPVAGNDDSFESVA